MTAPRRGRRVEESHRLALASFRLGGIFLIVAVGWGAWTLWRGGSWWGPLHSFLVGTVVLAISGASQMFTITWSAAPAPARVVTAGQRWGSALGAALVLIGVSKGIVPVVVAGAILVIGSLTTLAVSLVATVRRSLLRRFDLSARFYLVAVAAGAVGVLLGGMLGSGMVVGSYQEIRTVHMHLNLVGFIGMVIVGTLPTLLPTLAHHKAVSGREAVAGLWLALAAVVTMAAGLVGGDVYVGAGSTIGAVALFAVLSGVVFRLGRRGLVGRLAYLQVVSGSVWLGAWALADGARLMSGADSVPFSGLTIAAVVAGIAQILVGSLAYLIPVLAGPGPKLPRNFEKTHRRPWIPMTAANLSGGLLLLGWVTPALLLVGVWALDIGLRVLGLEWRGEA